MKKKYTVFLSSTYEDLREERNEVIHTLLEANCIPCGMEYFPSDNDKQFTFIKSVIDECDYYILIIGGRYGSIGKDGLSYTEMEYRYAVEKKIPVFAFIHNDIDSISVGKSEQNEQGREKLKTFIQTVSQSQMVKYWSGKDDLAKKVSTTMISAIDRHPAVGWIRGNFLPEELVSVFDKDRSSLVKVLLEIANQYKSQKNFEKAHLFLEWSYSLSPESMDVVREYGELYYDEQNFTMALKYWNKLLRMQKSCYHYCLCAYANYYLGHIAKAKEYINSALNFPDDGYRNRAKEFLAKLEPDENNKFA